MTISLAAMVRNEERCIAGMIRSVRSIVDEVIIVDTGSTDRTVEIATPLADKVIYTPFTNFGEVRTFTLKQATKDWILMLDADERIMSTDIYAIAAMTQQTQHDAWMIPRHQWDNLDNNPNGPEMEAVEARVYPDWQVRLFKNTPAMCYVNPVHESLRGFTSLGHLDPPVSPHIHHYAFVFKSRERIGESYKLYDELAKGQNYGKPTY